MGAATATQGGASCQPCATPGCTYLMNTSAAYRAAKPAHFHKHCCEACSKSGGHAHGGFCQRCPAARKPETSQNMTMYHGTSKENAERIHAGGFKPSEGGMLGKGVYMSRDINKARAYGAVVLEAEVDVGKVKKIDHQQHPQQKTWQGSHDTAWVPPKCGMVPSGLEENCIKDPNNIHLASRVHIL